MLTQIGAALALLVLTGSAFAQTFDRPFDSTRRNIQPQYRPAPAKSYSTPAAGPSIKPNAGQIGVPPPPSAYAGQIGVPPPPSAYTGTYNSTYGATPGNR
jgi:hypothetical protein